ncbi:hypothetical protein KDW36_16150 [Burkholderia dolosa]|uniref:hypothetical protein n=1 Tax=Burkholderia dolosa TaxID=152500 RepID=UPI001B9ADC97|nr:hypothetical protein [Burkholderia dolosa]MBR8314718.1 hypothetical protein [Burkholderia dolosa]
MNSRTRSNPLLNLAVAVACGAAAMYFFDPSSGRRRRAYVRDKAVASRHRVADYASTQAKRAADQARGAIAGLRADWLAGDGVAALHGVHGVEDALGARTEYRAQPGGSVH